MTFKLETSNKNCGVKSNSDMATAKSLSKLELKAIKSVGAAFLETGKTRMTLDKFVRQPKVKKLPRLLVKKRLHRLPRKKGILSKEARFKRFKKAAKKALKIIEYKIQNHAVAQDNSAEIQDVNKEVVIDEHMSEKVLPEHVDQGEKSGKRAQMDSQDEIPCHQSKRQKIDDALVETPLAWKEEQLMPKRLVEDFKNILESSSKTAIVIDAKFGDQRESESEKSIKAEPIAQGENLNAVHEVPFVNLKMGLSVQNLPNEGEEKVTGNTKTLASTDAIHPDTASAQDTVCSCQDSKFKSNLFKSFHFLTLFQKKVYLDPATPT